MNISLRRIVLTGFMGAGKSTIGRLVAERLQWTFVDLDEAIVQAEQRSIAAIFEDSGEAYFRQVEHRVLQFTLEREEIVLALGGGAIENPATRSALQQDPAALMIYLEAPLEVLIARCETQYRAIPNATRRPVLEQRAELAERYSRRKPIYETAHWSIPTAEVNAEQAAEEILRRWQALFLTSPKVGRA